LYIEDLLHKGYTSYMNKQSEKLMFRQKSLCI